MKRPVPVLLFLIACLLPAKGQQMRVEEFEHRSRPLFHRAEVPVDKDFALMDFATEEKGFSFLAGGKPAEAEEGDGVVTVKLPHRTAYVTVEHPEFGRLVWRVPGGKVLKRHRHYAALLIAYDPTKDYKAPRQWAVFHLDPGDALVQVDSATVPVRGGTAEYLLPVGEHRYKVEAPFHDPVEGTFTLSDSVRTDISVHLQPFWSFLTVRTPWPEGELYVDGSPIGHGEATSSRLGEGPHRLTLFMGGICFCDSLLTLGRAEKRIMELSAADLRPRDIRKTDAVAVNPPAPAEGETLTQGAPVKLTAPDDRTEIWLDREPVGYGEWEGRLAPGFHLASTRRDGVESASTRLWIDSGFPQEIALAAPGTGYGLLNITSNVAGARILIDGEDYGQTPQIVRLDVSRRYEVSLSKNGFREARKTVRPQGNRQVEVHLKLKKKRRI